MWYRNSILTKERISLILLILISVQLIPFNLLHFHNNQFGGFTVISIESGIGSEALQIKAKAPTCTFDKFLSLQNQNFTFEELHLEVGSSLFEEGLNFINQSKFELLPSDILNKGSPFPV